MMVNVAQSFLGHSGSSDTPLKPLPKVPKKFEPYYEIH